MMREKCCVEEVTVDISYNPCHVSLFFHLQISLTVDYKRNSIIYSSSDEILETNCG